MTALISALSRMAATAAIVAVTGLGAVAMAPAAFAAESASAVSAHVSSTVLQAELPIPAAVSMPMIMQTIHLSATLPIQSPLPDNAVTFVFGEHERTVPAQLAKTFQTIAAHVYAQLGYQVAFTSHGVLAVGNKVCDSAKSAAANTGCVAPTASRF